MQKSVAIVVPVHNLQLQWFEKIGLATIRRHFSHHDKYLIVPKKTPIREKDWSDFRVFEMQEHWGEYGETTVNSYNRLLRSLYFYRTFAAYEYILIAQLDVLILRDDLAYWCQSGYDYVGAPWLQNLRRHHPYLRDILPRRWLHPLRRKYFVGNGGLSLRKVSAFIEILERYQQLGADWESRVQQQANQYHLDTSYEDNFWCIYVPWRKIPIHIAPWREALKFSFETDPFLAYKLNNNQLPMGAHAWFRHEVAFWLPIVEEMGFPIVPERKQNA
jgi:hypothetical protein